MEHKYNIYDISNAEHWYDVIESMSNKQVVYHEALASPDPDMFNSTYNVRAEYMKCVEESKDFACLVAYRVEDPETPVGFTAIFEFDERPVHPHTTGYIMDVFVEDECRGVGLGHMLMEAAMKWFASHEDMRTVTLEVWAGNERVQKLYRQYGFEVRNYEMTVVLPSWKKDPQDQIVMKSITRD